MEVIDCRPRIVESPQDSISLASAAAPRAVSRLSGSWLENATDSSITQIKPLGDMGCVVVHKNGGVDVLKVWAIDRAA